MIKDQSINIIKNSDLRKKMVKIFKKSFFFSLYKGWIITRHIIKEVKERLLEHAKRRYHRKSGTEQAKKYEKNIEERLQEQDQNKYRELSNQEKDLKIIYGRNR